MKKQTKKYDWLKYADFDSIDLSEMDSEERKLIRRAMKADDDSVYYSLGEGGYVFVVILTERDGTTKLIQLFEGYIIVEGGKNHLIYEDGDRDYRWHLSDNGLYIIGIYQPPNTNNFETIPEVLRRGFSESKLTEDIRLEKKAAKEFVKRIHKQTRKVR